MSITYQDKVVAPWQARQLVGHTASITKVCFNKDGRRLASGSLDSSVLVWDLYPTTTCVRYTSHYGGVLGLCWSPKAEFIASTGVDRTTRIWRPDFKTASVTLNYSEVVRGVHFDPTGTKIVTASDDAFVALWDMSKLQLISTFDEHDCTVRSAKFSPTGELIASCSHDQTTRIFDSRSGQCVRLFAERVGAGKQIAWHPNGHVVAVALSQNRIKLFDIAQDRLMHMYHMDGVDLTDVSFHPSGKFLLSAGTGTSILLMDVLTARKMYMLGGHTDIVQAVSFSNDGSQFATGGCCSQMILWKTFPQPLVYQNQCYPGNPPMAQCDPTPLGDFGEAAACATTADEHCENNGLFNNLVTNLDKNNHNGDHSELKGISNNDEFQNLADNLAVNSENISDNDDPNEFTDNLSLNSENTSGNGDPKDLADNVVIYSETISGNDDPKGAYWTIKPVVNETADEACSSAKVNAEFTPAAMNMEYGAKVIPKDHDHFGIYAHINSGNILRKESARDNFGSKRHGNRGDDSNNTGIRNACGNKNNTGKGKVEDSGNTEYNANGKLSKNYGRFDNCSSK